METALAILRRLISELFYLVRLWLHCLVRFHRPYVTCFLTGDIERGCADCGFPRFEGNAV